MRAYAAVTAACWACKSQDGALRFLVLLHLISLGFIPVQLAWLFVLYAVTGIVTNLATGWLDACFGLAATLYGGPALQIGALVAMAQHDPAWGIAALVGFVMVVQGLCGAAKDLARMSSNSAVKLPAPKEDGGLVGRADRIQERGPWPGIFRGGGAAGAASDAGDACDAFDAGVSDGGPGHSRGYWPKYLAGVLAAVLIAG